MPCALLHCVLHGRVNENGHGNEKGCVFVFACACPPKDYLYYPKEALDYPNNEFDLHSTEANAPMTICFWMLGPIFVKFLLQPFYIPQALRLLIHVAVSTTYFQPPLILILIVSILDKIGEVHRTNLLHSKSPFCFVLFYKETSTSTSTSTPTPRHNGSKTSIPRSMYF